MRIDFALAAFFVLASGASAAEYGQPPAIVRGDDGMEHVDSFTLVGAVDFDKSEGDRLVIMAQLRQVRSEDPPYGGIQNCPDLRP